MFRSSGFFYDCSTWGCRDPLDVAGIAEGFPGPCLGFRV